MDFDAFAEAWEAAWNSHDLDRILAHYSEAVTFRSHKAMRRVGTGELQGKTALRAYWAKALAAQPNLSFVVVDPAANISERDWLSVQRGNLAALSRVGD